MAKPTLLPNLNPFLPYLAESVRFLNRAVAARYDADAGSNGWPAALSRTSAFHSIGAAHAALQAAIFFEDGVCEDSWTLREKADTYIHARLGRKVELPEAETRILAELDLIANVIACPQMRQAEIFPSDKKDNLIQFPRTEIKKISLETTTWVPQYAACVLAMTLGFLRRIFGEYAKITSAQREIYFGDHAHNAEGYSTRLNPNARRLLVEEMDFLRGNEEFIKDLQGIRWQLEPELFSIEFVPGL